MRNGSVSSVGRVGEPYYDPANNRVKGFCPEVLDNIDLVQEYVNRAMALRDSTHATRITLRFLTTFPIIEYGEGLSEYRSIEAEIPLTGRWEGVRIIYAGHNSPERFVPTNISRQEYDLIANLLAEQRKGTITRRVETPGYTTSILSNPTEADLDQLSQVYSRTFDRYMFPLTRENIASLLSPPNIVSVARDREGSIVSSVVGEIMELHTSRGDIGLCEYSDEATLTEHRRRGLGKACIQSLYDELKRNGTDVLYAEARACSIGANKVPASLGFKYAGRLKKHCIIGGAKDIAEEGPFENLNVWYRV